MFPESSLKKLNLGWMVNGEGRHAGRQGGRSVHLMALFQTQSRPTHQGLALHQGPHFVHLKVFF
jgi:hypothetical protein